MRKVLVALVLVVLPAMIIAGAGPPERVEATTKNVILELAQIELTQDFIDKGFLEVVGSSGDPSILTGASAYVAPEMDLWPSSRRFVVVPALFYWRGGIDSNEPLVASSGGNPAKRFGLGSGTTITT